MNARGRAGAERRIRVLVVDDLVLLRRMMVRQLAAAGHVVVGEAGTVAEAVERARALAPDVLVLDVHLPDGLGTEIAARVAAGSPGGPAVVFCTGDPGGASLLMAGAAEPAGCAWPVLGKPASAALLHDAVCEAAAQRRGAAPAAPISTRTPTPDGAAHHRATTSTGSR